MRYVNGWSGKTSRYVVDEKFGGRNGSNYDEKEQIVKHLP